MEFTKLLKRLIRTLGHSELGPIFQCLLILSEEVPLVKDQRNSIISLQGQYTYLASQKSFMRPDDYMIALNGIRSNVLSLLEDCLDYEIKARDFTGEMPLILSDNIQTQLREIERNSLKFTSSNQRKIRRRIGPVIGLFVLMGMLAIAGIQGGESMRAVKGNDPVPEKEKPSGDHIVVKPPSQKEKNKPSDQSHSPAEAKVESSRQLPKQPLKEEEQKMDLAIYTVPGSVEIFKNGEFLDKTSKAAGGVSIELAEGSHILEFRKSGYQSTRERVNIPKQQTLQVELEKE